MVKYRVVISNDRINKRKLYDVYKGVGFSPSNFVTRCRNLTECRALVKRLNSQSKGIKKRKK